ncbi:MAG: hypothetical protein COX57_13720 [Alphaproteobacteria bacterium CG_4_10_14_0_2_um_filter_63_37]|nr:MAG: hypothetical protein AUJ55_08580 [Proteobacteria bacterium CG1_02_64_396]PJA23429.1 MAG: hypothetical protein COX57_13720 [Alphaproteobacteria bacterium CG_4_10_14_0_2_um_filter_63_37]
MRGSSALSEWFERLPAPAVWGLIAAVAMMLVDGPHGRLKTPIWTLASPLLEALHTPLSVYRHVEEEVGSWLLQRERIQTLEQQISQLRSDLADAAVVRSERDRLAQLLGMERPANFKALAAFPIGFDPEGIEWLMLDRGSADGVESGQIVVAAQGLVGQVREVSHWTCRVELITASTARIPIESQDNHARAILVGQGGQTLQISFLKRGLPMPIGEQWLTSGMGGRFPAGIPVAQTLKVLTEEGAFASASAQPLVPFSALRSVLLLVPLPTPTPVQGGGK